VQSYTTSVVLGVPHRLVRVLNRDKRFIPDFDGYTGIMYLGRPEGDEDHPKLELNYFYRRSDYEPENRS
jgi:hypothetical protein